MNSIWESYGGQWGLGEWTIVVDKWTPGEHRALYRISQGGTDMSDMLLVFYGPPLRMRLNEQTPFLSQYLLEP